MSALKKENIEPWLVNLKAFALESGLYNKHADGTIECLKSVKLEKEYVDSFNGLLGNLPKEFGGSAAPAAKAAPPAAVPPVAKQSLPGAGVPGVGVPGAETQQENEKKKLT